MLAERPTVLGAALRRPASPALRSTFAGHWLVGQGLALDSNQQELSRSISESSRRLRRERRKLRGSANGSTSWALAVAGAAASAATVGGSRKRWKNADRPRKEERRDGLWFKPPVAVARYGNAGRGRRILNVSVEVLARELKLNFKEATNIAKRLQRWVVTEEGEDPTGTRTKRWARRLCRGLEQHPQLRSVLFNGPDGPLNCLAELEKRSRGHGNRVLAIENQHQAVADGEEGDLDGYSEASAWMGASWWLSEAHARVADWIDQFFLLTPEQMRRGHPIWVFKRKIGLPPGWKKYTVAGRSMFWNPKAKKMQTQAPEGIGGEREAPPHRDPPVALLDVGSCTNPFDRYPEIITPTAIDLRPDENSRGVMEADFFEVPILDRTADAEADAEGSGERRIILSDEGALEGIIAGSFDVVVCSLVLSFVQDPEKRIEMVSRARRCLRDDRGLFVVLEVGSVLADCSWYHGDPAEDWTKAIEGAGFRLLKFDEEIRDGKKKPKMVNQWVFQTAPVPKDGKLTPLLTPKDMW